MPTRFKTDDIDKFFDYNINLITRTLYMGSCSSDEEWESGVDAKMAEYVIKGLHVLDNSNKGADNGEQPINVIMNNIGGDAYHGLAIYDAVSLCKNRVIITVFGHAMSMGSIILQAADERIMAPNARMMIHYGTAGYVGHAPTSYKWTEECKKFDVWMETLYLDKIREKNPNFSNKRLQEWLKADTFLTSEETVKYNLADSIAANNH